MVYDAFLWIITLYFKIKIGYKDINNLVVYAGSL